MFNFHKPRVYRSTEGCCICRAKSSSSRFTDSRKYEHECMECFNLKYPRHGEICNACVLLVKRYKRLPFGSKRHWGHVVDARAGPGTKSLAKQKKRDDPDYTGNSGSSKYYIPEKFAKIFKKKRNDKTTSKTRKNSPIKSNTSKNKLNSSGGTRNSSECSENHTDSNESYDDSMEQLDNKAAESHSASVSYVSSNVEFQTQTRSSAQKKITATRPHVKVTGCKRRQLMAPVKNRSMGVDKITFFDAEDMVKLEICCGVTYRHRTLKALIVIDTNEYKMCEKHRKQGMSTTQKVKPEPTQKAEQELSKDPLSEISLVSIKQTLPNVCTQPLKTEFSMLPSTIRLEASSTKPTPALKKHHLFFKRQSESFPHATNIDQASSNTIKKTDIAVNTPDDKSSSSPANCSAEGINFVPTDTHSNSQSTHTKIITQSAAKVTPPPLLITAVGAQSPSSLSTSSTCSSSSSSASSATKFNDNSSDSGFDEHVQDRKSASPSTQDESTQPILSSNKKTLPTRNPGLQRLILANGVQITGQAQNLVLAGNEFAARLIQQRRQKVNSIKIGNQPNNSFSTIALPNVAGSYSGNNSSNRTKKVYTIYNSSSTIQHGNGVTTILPASSVVANNQTSVMNAVVPNTVTITPTLSATELISPPISFKTTTTAGSVSQTLPITFTGSSNKNSGISGNNQKIILVKSGVTSAAMAVVPAASNRHIS